MTHTRFLLQTGWLGWEARARGVAVAGRHRLAGRPVQHAHLDAASGGQALVFHAHCDWPAAGDADERAVVHHRLQRAAARAAAAARAHRAAAEPATAASATSSATANSAEASAAA